MAAGRLKKNMTFSQATFRTKLPGDGHVKLTHSKTFAKWTSSITFQTSHATKADMVRLQGKWLSSCHTSTQMI